MKSFLDNEAAKKLIEYALYSGQGNGRIMCTDDKQNQPDFGSNQDLLKLTSTMVDQKNPKCAKPRITGISKSSQVESGKSLLLKCIAKGNPMPTIEWKAPNEDTYRLTSDDFEGVTVHQDGSMLIEDIRTSDAVSHIFFPVDKIRVEALGLHYLGGRDYVIYIEYS